MRPLLALAPFALALAAGASAQTPLPANSPFVPAGTPANATAPGETLEFSGVSSMGRKTTLIFKDTATKKQSWVAVGETTDGITVVKYDPKAEQAVVKVNGAQKVLTLRAASAPTAAPAAVAPVQGGFNVPTPPASEPAPTSPAPTPPPAQPVTEPTGKPATPPTPQEQVRAETEARMLVSDLLEIGMAQRKAYEEAQRKAAEGGNAPPTPPAPAPATPGGK